MIYYIVCINNKYFVFFDVNIKILYNIFFSMVVKNVIVEFFLFGLYLV